MHDGLWFRIRSVLEFLFLFGFLTLIGSLFVSFSVLLGKYELITLAFVLLAASSLRVLLSEEKQERLKELPLVGGAVKLYDKLELHYKTQPPTFFLYYLFFPITGPIGFLFSRNARKELAVYASLIQWMLLLLLAEGVASYYRLYRHFDAGFVMDWFYLELLIIYFLCNFFTIPVATSSMRLRLSGRNKQLFAVTTMSCLVLGVLTAYYTMDERYRNLIPINVILDKRISKLKEREAYKRAHVPIPSSLKKYNFFPRFERATQIFMHHHGPAMLRFFRKHYFDKGTDKQEEYLEYINGAYQRQLAPLMPLGESEQFFLTTTQGRQHFWGVIMVPFRESVFYFFRYDGLRLRLYKRWVDISAKDRRALLRRWNQDAYLFSNGKRLAQLIVERMRGIATYLEEKRKLRAQQRKQVQERAAKQEFAQPSGDKAVRPTRSSANEAEKYRSQDALGSGRRAPLRYRSPKRKAPKKRAARRYRRMGRKKRHPRQESPSFRKRAKSKANDAIPLKKTMPSIPRLRMVPAPPPAAGKSIPHHLGSKKKMPRPDSIKPPKRKPSSKSRSLQTQRVKAKKLAAIMAKRHQGLQTISRRLLRANDLLQKFDSFVMTLAYELGYKYKAKFLDPRKFHWPDWKTFLSLDVPKVSDEQNALYAELRAFLKHDLPVLSPRLTTLRWTLYQYDDMSWRYQLRNNSKDLNGLLSWLQKHKEIESKARMFLQDTAALRARAKSFVERFGHFTKQVVSAVEQKKKTRDMFTLYHYRLFEFDFKRAMTMRLLYDHFGATPELKKTWWTVLYEWIISLMFNLFYLAMPVHMVVIGISFLRERSLAKKEAEDDEATDESDRDGDVSADLLPKDPPKSAGRNETGTASKDRVQARGTVEFGVQHITFSDVVSGDNVEGKTTPFGVDTSSLQEKVSDVSQGATTKHNKTRTDWVLRFFVGYVFLSIPMLIVLAVSQLDHHYRWLRTTHQDVMEFMMLLTVWIQPLGMYQRYPFWLAIFQLVSVCVFAIGLFALWRRKTWCYFYWQCILCVWLLSTFVNVYMVHRHTLLTTLLFSSGFLVTLWMLWRFQVHKRRV